MARNAQRRQRDFTLGGVGIIRTAQSPGDWAYLSQSGLVVPVPVADDLVSLPGLTPIAVMPMHRAVDQCCEKDERSNEVDNFHSCPPFSLNPPRKMRFR